MTAARRILFLIALLLAARDAGAQTVDELRAQLAREQARNAELMRRIDRLEQQLAARQAVAAPPTDEAGSRALERALVREGGSLLPAFGLEVEPGAAWAHSDVNDALGLDDAIDGAVGVRLGLPRGFQVSTYAPYSMHTSYNGRSARGLRDVSVQLSKQLVNVNGARPGLIADFGWTTSTGRTGNGGVSLGSGFDTGRGRLTMIKVAEPLVFVAQGTFAHAMSRAINGAEVRPGDTIGVRAGTTLAATPGMSLFLGVNLQRQAAARRNGIELAGSGEVIGFLETNLGVVLSRRTFLNLGASFGVTGTGRPDTIFEATLPIRF